VSARAGRGVEKRMESEGEAWLGQAS